MRLSILHILVGFCLLFTGSCTVSSYGPSASSPTMRNQLAQSTSGNSRSRFAPLITEEFIDWEAVPLIPKKSAIRLLQQTANVTLYPRCDVRAENIPLIEQPASLPATPYPQSDTSAVWLRGDPAKGSRMYKIIMVLPGKNICNQVTEQDLAFRACIIHIEPANGVTSSKFGSVLTALASLGSKMCTFDYTHTQLVYN